MEVYASKCSPDSVKRVDSAVSAVFASQYLDKGVEKFMRNLSSFSDQELVLAIRRFEHRIKTGDFNVVTASVRCIDIIIDELSCKGSNLIPNLKEEKRRNLDKFGHMMIDKVKDPENQHSFESLRDSVRSLDNARLLFKAINNLDGVKEVEDYIKEIRDTYEDETKKEAIVLDIHLDIGTRRKAIAGLDGYRSQKLLEFIAENATNPGLLRLSAINRLEMPSRPLLERLSDAQGASNIVAMTARWRLVSLRRSKVA